MGVTDAIHLHALESPRRRGSNLRHLRALVERAFESIDTVQGESRDRKRLGRPHQCSQRPKQEQLGGHDLGQLRARDAGDERQNEDHRRAKHVGSGAGQDDQIADHGRASSTASRDVARELDDLPMDRVLLKPAQAQFLEAVDEVLGSRTQGRIRVRGTDHLRLQLPFTVKIVLNDQPDKDDSENTGDERLPEQVDNDEQQQDPVLKSAEQGHDRLRHRLVVARHAIQQSRPTDLMQIAQIELQNLHRNTDPLLMERILDRPGAFPQQQGLGIAINQQQGNECQPQFEGNKFVVLFADTSRYHHDNEGSGDCGQDRDQQQVQGRGERNDG